MKKMTKKILIVGVVVLVAAAIVGGVSYAVYRQSKEKEAEETLPTTEVDKLLAKDLELKYPATPTEVVKLYWRFNRCMYNKEMSDEDFEGLLVQLRMLYDEEFLAAEENAYDTMLENFKTEKEQAEKSDQVLSACIVQDNDTVDVTEVDEVEYASVISSTLMKANGETEKVYEEFILRRDDSGNWKILGWQESDESAAEAVGVE